MAWEFPLPLWFQSASPTGTTMAKEHGQGGALPRAARPFRALPWAGMRHPVGVLAALRLEKIQLRWGAGRFAAGENPAPLGCWPLCGWRKTSFVGVLAALRLEKIQLR